MKLKSLPDIRSPTPVGSASNASSSDFDLNSSAASSSSYARTTPSPALSEMGSKHIRKRPSARSAIELHFEEKKKKDDDKRNERKERDDRRQRQHDEKMEESRFNREVEEQKVAAFKAMAEMMKALR